MTEHVAHEPAPPAPAEHDSHDAHHGHDNSPEAIRAEIRKYLIVLGALAILTIITVFIARFHLPTHQAVALALVVASIKGTLVAAFFMHLISERKLIYAVLVFTVFFFGMLMWGPWHHRHNAQQQWKGYDLNASSPAPKAPTDEHSGH